MPDQSSSCRTSSPINWMLSYFLSKWNFPPAIILQCYTIISASEFYFFVLVGYPRFVELNADGDPHPFFPHDDTLARLMWRPFLSLRTTRAFAAKNRGLNSPLLLHPLVRKLSQMSLLFQAHNILSRASKTHLKWRKKCMQQQPGGKLPLQRKNALCAKIFRKYSCKKKRASVAGANWK